MARMTGLKSRIGAGARVLGRDTGSLLAAAPLTLALYAGVLLLPPQLAMAFGTDLLYRLSDLLLTLALRPLFAALTAVTLAAAWRRHPRGPALAARAVGGQILRVLATGICAWALSLALDLFTGLVGAIAGLLNTLTDWIPGVGAVIGWVLGALVWLATQAQLFLALVLLVYGMAALTVDGLWALPQAKRALASLWGGRTDSLPALIALFVLWAAAHVPAALVNMTAGGTAALVVSGLTYVVITAVCVSAIMAIYLRERDRQDGWTL